MPILGQRNEIPKMENLTKKMATLHSVLILAALTSLPLSLTLQTKTVITERNSRRSNHPNSVFQGEDAEHMLTIIHDITTNNIGSLCYHNTYKSVRPAEKLIH